MAEHEQQREEGGSGTSLAPERPRVEPPRKFKVWLVNDDYTPMEFVVQVLVSIFSLAPAQAVEVMLAVHHKGRGVAGVYSRDIAETKAAQVHEAARAAQHPLRCTVEPA